MAMTKVHGCWCNCHCCTTMKQSTVWEHVEGQFRSHIGASQVWCQNSIPRAQIFTRFSIVLLEDNLGHPANPWHKLRASLVFHIIFMTLFHNMCMYKTFMLFDDLRMSTLLGSLSLYPIFHFHTLPKVLWGLFILALGSSIMQNV